MINDKTNAPVAVPDERAASIRYDVLHEFATKHRVDYNELCTTARAALAATPAAAPNTESVLIDGVAYDVPPAVAGELLSLHLDLVAATPAVPAEGFELWWADHMPNATQAEAWAAWVAVHQDIPAEVQAEPVAWRKRADEIELQVAQSGSTEAMRCFTDMRTLLQAATAPQANQPQAPAAPSQASPEWEKVHRGLTMVMLGLAGRRDCTESVVEAALDVVTEPGMPLAGLRALAGVSAPAGAVEPTDAELIALNAGECYFSESPSKYPELGHGTQYHAGAPGVLGFARAALALRADPAAYSQKFQQRVQPWMMACFGPEISADRIERNHRFLEEALELVQACGCSASEAHQLVDYVFGRPVGELVQEAGGAMVTLAALCLANGLDMHAAGETELARIWTKVEAIRAKQAAKPKHSPLPVAPAAPAVDAETIHLQDLKNALANCKALRQQLTLMDEQQAGSVWRWQADGQDHLESMGNHMGVLIRACDLRALLAGVAAPAAYSLDATPAAAPVVPKWIDDPHDIEQGQMLNPEWVKVQEVASAPAVDALDAKDRECIAIGRAIQRAAGELPVDGEIRIDIENGAGAVYVLEPKHGDWCYIDSGDVLSAQINEAIDAAIAAAQAKEGGAQ